MNSNRQKSKNEKTLNILRLILIICIALYNAVLFISTIYFEKTLTFWISYVFVMLAPIIIFALSFRKKWFTGGTNLTLSLPLMRIVWSYLSLEFVIGNLFIIFSKDNPLILALIVQILVLAIFTIVFLIVLAGARKISDDYQKQKQDVFNLNKLFSSVSLVAYSVKDKALKDKLSQIAEQIRFSDYNSYLENFDLEKDIDDLVTKLENSQNEEASMQIALRLERLIYKRESNCKFIKKMRG